MRVVHLLNSYGTNYGTQEVVRNLVQQETEAGYTPEIITSDLSKNTTTDICKVTRIPALFTFSRTPFTPSLVRHILSKDADIFHLHGPLPWFDSVLPLKRAVDGKSKFVYTIQNLTPETQFLTRVLSFGYQNIALRIAAKIADVVITPTKALVQLLGRLVDPNKTVVIPNGVNVEEYTPSYKYSSNILFIGGIKPDKGIHVLIKAFRNIKHIVDNLTLNIVGAPLWKDDYYLRLRELTKSDPTIIWHGRVSEDRKKKILANSGVVVLPSVSLTEGFGLVLLEGMASGKPVVGSNLPTIAEWIDPSFGLLFQTGNADNLAQTIVIALQNAERLGINGRKCIEKRYNWNLIFEDYRNIYEILSRR
ncbi:MAG: glycosyltransferase family 4 protein [Candidatus Heimdallarchaeota archaeon]